MKVLHESLCELGAQHVHWGARPEDYVTARESLIAAIRGLSPSWDSALEGHWRSAITAIVVPMLQGAAVHTAVVAEQLAVSEDSCRSCCSRRARPTTRRLRPASR
jgi:hypothetical protein